MSNVEQLIKPDQKTIETLKGLLKEAESGNLQSIIFVDKYKDDAVGYGWAGLPNLRMIGEIELAKVDFLTQKLHISDNLNE